MVNGDVKKFIELLDDTSILKYIVAFESCGDWFQAFIEIFPEVAPEDRENYCRSLRLTDGYKKIYKKLLEEKRKKEADEVANEQPPTLILAYRTFNQAFTSKDHGPAINALKLIAQLRKELDNNSTITVKNVTQMSEKDVREWGDAFVAEISKFDMGEGSQEGC